MSASLVPGEGKMPNLPAPADGAAGKAQMLANLDKVAAVKNRSAGFADWCAKAAAQARDWADTV